MTFPSNYCKRLPFSCFICYQTKGCFMSMKFSFEVEENNNKEESFLSNFSPQEKGWLSLLNGQAEELEKQYGRSLGYIYALICSVLQFTTSISFKASAAQGASVNSIITTRAFMFLAGFIVLTRYFHIPVDLLAFLKSWKNLSIVFFGFSVPQMFFGCLKALALSDAQILFMLSPLFSIVWGPILLKTSLSLKEVLILCFALFGITLTVQPVFLFQDLGIASFSLIGLFLGLGYSAVNSLYAYLVKLIGDELSANEKLYLFTLGIFLSGLFFSAFEFWKFLQDLGTWNYYPFWILIAMSTSLFGYFWIKAPCFIPIQRVLMLQYLSVIYSICFDSAMGSFEYNWLKIIGISAVLLSSLAIISLHS